MAPGSSVTEWGTFTTGPLELEAVPSTVTTGPLELGAVPSSVTTGPLELEAVPSSGRLPLAGPGTGTLSPNLHCVVLHVTSELHCKNFLASDSGQGQFAKC